MADAIDIEHLSQYVGDDAALRDEILCIFQDQVEGWMERLDPASSDEDWRNAAHALKGASRGVGAFALGDFCEAAEALVGDERRRAGRSALLTELKESAASALAHVRRLRV